MPLLLTSVYLNCTFQTNFFFENFLLYSYSDLSSFQIQRLFFFFFFHRLSRDKNMLLWTGVLFLYLDQFRSVKKKKVASWDKIYTWQNKLWKLLKWKQRIKNTIYTVDNKAEAWFGRTDSKVEAWFGRNDSQCYCKLNRLQYSVINVTFLICPKK